MKKLANLLKFHRKNVLKDEQHIKLRKRIFNIFSCNFVRIVLIVENLLCIYYITKVFDNYLYALLIIFDVLILIDAIYVSIFRDGKEFSW